MIVPYNKQFENEGKWTKFIGYITPEGEELDYSRPFGLGGHDRNYVTDFFTNYLYHDIAEDYGRLITVNDKLEILEKEEYKKAFRNYCLQKLPQKCRNAEWSLKHGFCVLMEDLLELRLRNLFINCYQNEDFFLGYGRKIKLISEETFEEIYISNHDLSSMSYREKKNEIEYQYNNYLSETLLSYLKDTLVMYLGYDSVERMTPRTITTSHININERFYNYLLMDFTIHQVPKMIYDPSCKCYKPFTLEYQTEKEKILGMEIESIKKLIKREDRYRYFRETNMSEFDDWYD